MRAETVACMDMIERHKYSFPDKLQKVRELGHNLFVKIQAMRRCLQDRGPKMEGEVKLTDESRSSVSRLLSNKLV